MNIITRVSPLIKECELRSGPVVIRVNEFDKDSAKEFAQQMSMAQSTGQSVIPIIIDSYGGQVYALMSMIDAIKASRVPVATIVEGKAMSCGAVLLTCGTEGMRYAAPHATIMIHEVSTGSFGKVEEIKTDAKEVDRLNDKILKIMAKNIGKDEGFFLDEIHHKKHADWFIEPEEAKEMNLVNHVRMPEMMLTVDVKYKFE
jgi:ATP-dependent Clp protease protease subunit